MSEKRTPRRNQSNVPIAGASSDPIFLLPERSAAPELVKGGRLKPQPKAPSNAERSLESPSRKTAKLERFGRTLSRPVLAPTGKWVQAKGATGAEHASDRAYREGRAPRPARPRREGRSTACAPPAACLPGRAPGSQAHALQGPREAAAPARSPDSLPPYQCAPARGPVDLRASRAQNPAAAAPAVERECEPPPASPFSSLSAPQSARGPAAPRHLTEDPWPGTAPYRPCYRPHACSAPRSAPRPRSRGPGQGGAWANPGAAGGRVTPG